MRNENGVEENGVERLVEVAARAIVARVGDGLTVEDVRPLARQAIERRIARGADVEYWARSPNSFPMIECINLGRNRQAENGKPKTPRARSSNMKRKRARPCRRWACMVKKKPRAIAMTPEPRSAISGRWPVIVGARLITTLPPRCIAITKRRARRSKRSTPTGCFAFRRLVL